MDVEYFEDNLPLEKRQEVECELDVLNQTAPQINDLENKLLIARLNYQETLTENANKLKVLSSRLGKCVQRARPYYELCQVQVERLSRIQSATKLYTNANVALAAAREELSKLEKNMAGCKDTDSLEIMNNAISRINATKKEAMDNYRIHQELLEEYRAAEQTLRRMERRNKSDVSKAKSYFETKQQFDRNMQEAKLQVDLCAEKVALCKSIYADAMARLEQISASVHDTRRRQTVASNQSSSPPSSVRGQGVGAESVESIVELGCTESDVISAAPRLNEKSTISSRTRLEFSSLNRTKARPFVHNLLQHVHDAELQLAVCDRNSILNSPVSRSTDQTPRLASTSVHSSALHFPQSSSTLSSQPTHTAAHVDSPSSQSYHHQTNCGYSSFGIALDYLLDTDDVTKHIWSSTHPTLYMKRAQSTIELPTGYPDLS